MIEEVTRSGLRGRGGGGFPTGRKWRVARDARGEPKYVIANGDEGDPGAFMDRSLMEGSPHSVLEGMLIGAYAIGASQGYIYVRHEYPMAVERLARCAIAGRARAGAAWARTSWEAVSVSIFASTAAAGPLSAGNRRR